MTFMNDAEVEEARGRWAGHPILGPATLTLANLVAWTNSNSDGWAYWAKPKRAAEKLMTLIQGDGTARYLLDDEREDVTEEAYRAALRPIKAFRTRHAADFEIVEELDDDSDDRDLPLFKVTVTDEDGVVLDQYEVRAERVAGDGAQARTAIKALVTVGDF